MKTNVYHNKLMSEIFLYHAVEYDGTAVIMLHNILKEVIIYTDENGLKIGNVTFSHPIVYFHIYV